MKKNEFRSKERPQLVCEVCGAELDFADMTCRECGADARHERVAYEPELERTEIQREVRKFAGAAPEPTGDFGKNSISFLRLILPLLSVGLGIVAAITAGKGVAMNIIIGIVVGAIAIALSKAVTVILTNNAIAAESSVRSANNAEYMVQQLHQFMNLFVEDGSISDDNAEVFAKMLNKIIKIEDAQARMLDRLNQTFYRGVYGTERDKGVESEPARTEKPQKPARQERPAKHESARKPEAAEVPAKPEPKSEPKPEPKPAEPVEEKTEEQPVEVIAEPAAEPKAEEQPAEPAVEETEQPTEPEAVTEPEEAPAEEAEAEPETEPADTDTEGDDDDDEAYIITCPHCDAELERTEEELAVGSVTCDTCGGMFRVEVADEEESDEDDEGDEAPTLAEDFNDDGFFGDDADESTISRLDALLDD